MSSIHPETGGLSKRDKKMMGSRLPEVGELAKVRQFKIGEEVRIRRSDGTIEDGWAVIIPRTGEPGNERVVVVKTGPGGHFMRKGVRVEELSELNPLAEA